MVWFDSFSGGVKRLVAICVCSIGIAAISVSAGAVAGESRIDVVLCNPNDQTSLSITQPPSDSVTTHQTVTVAGTVNNATRIDILVDGNFRHDITLSENQTSFSTSVNLSVGTHTITAKAIAICDFPDVSRSVVVTHQPSSPSSPPLPPPIPTPSSPPTLGGAGLAFLSPDGGIQGQERELIPGDEVPTEVPAEGIDPLEDILFGERIPPWPLSYVMPNNPWWSILRLIIFILGLAWVVYPLFFARRVAHAEVPPYWLVALFRVVGLLMVVFAIFGLGLL